MAAPLASRGARALARTRAEDGARLRALLRERLNFDAIVVVTYAPNAVPAAVTAGAKRWRDVIHRAWVGGVARRWPDPFV